MNDDEGEGKRGKRERAIISSRGAMSRRDGTAAGRETVFRNFFVPFQDDIGLMIYIRKLRDGT